MIVIVGIEKLISKNTEIKNIFSDEEIKQVEAFMKKVKKSTNDNDKKIIFYKYIESYLNY